MLKYILMTRVLDDKPDVILLGKLDARRGVGRTRHVDSIADVVSERAGC